MGHSVNEAINRQLVHYPYHIGQIVFIGKTVTYKNWKSLSIPFGKLKNTIDENLQNPCEPLILRMTRALGVFPQRCGVLVLARNSALQMH